MSTLFDLGDECDDPWEPIGEYDCSDDFINDEESHSETSNIHRGLDSGLGERKRKHSSIGTTPEEEDLFVGRERDAGSLQPVTNGPNDGPSEPSQIPGITKPGSRLGKKNSFRCKNQRIFLTYSQIGSAWDPQPLIDTLDGLGATHRLGREFHKDGGIHYHCYVDFGRPYEFENCHKFCFGGSASPNCPKGGHCNILVIRRTPHFAWDYAGKDGDIISENCPRPLVVKGQSERKAEWVYCLDAPAENEFYARIKETDPAALCKSSQSIEHCAKRLFRTRKAETYAGIVGLRFDWRSFPSVAQWVLRALPDGADRIRRIAPDFTDGDERELRRGIPRYLIGGRRPSLILWGESLHGKTDFARALGEHFHFGNDFSLSELILKGVENIEYGVLDDLDWTDAILKGNKYKAWLGAQEHFICTDKFLRKESITWGKPCIFLSNDDPTVALKPSDYKWVQKNCWVVEVPDGTPIARRPDNYSK